MSPAISLQYLFRVAPDLAGRLASVAVALPPDADRFKRLGPNHHLWRNGRYWWIAFTVILDGWRQERLRFSLRTDDVVEARRRRDEILAHLCDPGRVWKAAS
ncbi:MAG: hypothetical protein KJ061_12710 [Vicinamibacteraceae bacterium]|nr:hypothetical protein [Vicinamibacteraceae bacterium]